MQSESFYFAYGSNMSSTRLRERVPGARSLGAARLLDMRLCFNKLGRDGSGKANLVAAPGSIGWGVVFAIAQPDFSVLDRFERGYERKIAQVETLRGEPTRVQTYLAPASAPDLTPHAWYVEHLIEGAREHGHPVERIAWLRALDVLAR